MTELNRLFWEGWRNFGLARPLSVESSVSHSEGAFKIRNVEIPGFVLCQREARTLLDLLCVGTAVLVHWELKSHL